MQSKLLSAKCLPFYTILMAILYQNIKKLKQVWAAGYIVVDWLFHSPSIETTVRRNLMLIQNTENFIAFLDPTLWSSDLQATKKTRLN